MHLNNPARAFPFPTKKFPSTIYSPDWTRWWLRKFNLMRVCHWIVIDTILSCFMISEVFVLIIFTCRILLFVCFILSSLRYWTQSITTIAVVIYVDGNSTTIMLLFYSISLCCCFTEAMSIFVTVSCSINLFSLEPLRCLPESIIFIPF